ncbi:uncharacterized protein LOC118181959 [Stegodyphus dumicola]|uniref:uncharacterized protein LOC118181959 n=1 Tax=Stegodyphus dumicola TaxID=202533 RepID=UPI0015AAF0D8|nr:uncharacterized protein LOC118181959 [Stegodyphus dumicola]
MASNNLHLHNSPGAQPTFDNSYHKGWPNLTLSTSDIVINIYSWTVMDVERNSDHKYIHFLIQVDTSISILKRIKLPGGKIRHLHRILSETLKREETELNTHNDQYDMNIYTDNVLTTLRCTCERILPIRTAKKLQGITWWTKQLRQMRQRCRALRRRLRRAGDGTETERLVTAFRQARATYKKAILEAKINSWRNFCTSNSNPYGILHKLATQKIFQPAQVPVQPGNLPQTTDLAGSTTTALLDAIFPADPEQDDTTAQRLLRNATETPKRQKMSPLQYRKSLTSSAIYH